MCISPSETLTKLTLNLNQNEEVSSYFYLISLWNVLSLLFIKILHFKIHRCFNHAIFLSRRPQRLGGMTSSLYGFAHLSLREERRWDQNYTVKKKFHGTEAVFMYPSHTMEHTLHGLILGTERKFQHKLFVTSDPVLRCPVFHWFMSLKKSTFVILLVHYKD